MAEMKELVITDNTNEKIRVKCDGERFAITHKDKNKLLGKWGLLQVIILNYAEAAIRAEIKEKAPHGLGYMDSETYR